jgi:acetyltransferase-like isoleucine patch superfamily enzyme
LNISLASSDNCSNHEGIEGMISVIKRRLELSRFQKQWRTLNPHNKTTAVCKFNINKVSVGNHTYGPLNVMDFYYDNERLEIGHFCSIANGVKFILAGNHFMDRPTTFPVKTFFMGHTGGEGYSKGPIVVGSDVWFGFDAWVLSGVKIGQGAVIGARSLVAKDVPPYAVVAGNPAKVLKYRFADEIIHELVKIDYSQMTSEFCREHIDFLTHSFTLDEVRRFIAKLSSR